MVFPELANCRSLARLEAHYKITGPREVRDAYIGLLETLVPCSRCT
jgi:hypothetical protein